jgi:manganese/zinc/iron transport system permease protein
MSTTIEQFLTIDLAPLLTASACSVACAILGSFLLLRRQSLMGDAIAHSVLPGLAGAFLLLGTRATLPMFVGALVAGVLAAMLSEGVRRLAKVEAQAAMGVVFSIMFALGVLLMSLPSMRLVDLDADCVLNGVLETISWLPERPGDAAPRALSDLLSPAIWLTAPRQLIAALAVCLIVITCVSAFWKELKLASFDPGLAAALGFRPGLVNAGLITLTALVSVASFEAVGSILVIAMIICPAATARMLTDRLGTQVILGAVIGLFCSLTGYLLGAFGPSWIGLDSSVSAAGMMTVIAGLVLATAIVFAPEHGVLSRLRRQSRVHITVTREDLLAMLYRLEEAAEAGSPRTSITRAQAASALAGGRAPQMAIKDALAQHLVTQDTNQRLNLTDTGRAAARAIVRTHRLWEVYLVNELGLRPDHVHGTAMRMEHFTTPDMQPILQSAPGAKGPTDPHGRPLPQQ